MTDFHPDHICQQIPEMKRLVAVRNLLKELRANMADNNLLKEKLNELIKKGRKK